MRSACRIVALFRTSTFATTGSSNRKYLETGSAISEFFYGVSLGIFWTANRVVICKVIQGRDCSYTFSLHANSSEFCSIRFACLRKLCSLAPKSPNKAGGECSWMHQAGTRKWCEWKWFSIVDALQLQSLRSHIWIPHHPIPRSEGRIPDQRLFADPFEISKCHQFIPLWLGASSSTWKSGDQEGTRVAVSCKFIQGHQFQVLAG